MSKVFADPTLVPEWVLPQPCRTERNTRMCVEIEVLDVILHSSEN